MISNKKLLELYAAMIRCRAAAKFGAANGEIARHGGTPSGSIHEAIVAGVVIDLQPGDSLLHPSFGAEPRRMKEVPLDRFYLALAKNGHALKSPKQQPETDALKSIGKAARTSKEKKSAIAVAFCDGVDAPKAAWKKSFKQTSRKSLPILFVCDESSLHSSHRKKISETEALLHGVPVIVVDAHDVVAVYRVASESVARARQRRGPTIIATTECAPVPKSKSASRQTAASPSLAVMETHLKEQGLFQADKQARIERAFLRTLRTATRSRAR